MGLEMQHQIGLQEDRGLHLEGSLVFEYINMETGERRLVDGKNMITTAHKAQYANFLVGNTVNPPSYLALGTGAIAKYAETNVDTWLALKSTGANSGLGQVVTTPATGYTLRAVWLYMKRTGATAGSVYVEVQTVSGGLPTGTVVDTSTTVGTTTIATTADWVEFQFAARPALSASTSYAIVLKSTGYTWASGTTEIFLGVDQSSPSYSGGAGITWDGSSYTAIATATDCAFRLIADPGAAWTTLIDETTRKILTSKSLSGSTAARLLANFTTSEANDTHGEAALFDASSSGNMWTVIGIKIKKTSAEALNIYWILTVT